MRPDLTACGAQGIDAWLLGLLLALAMALVPFLFSLRRGRASLGCALTVLLLALVPTIWLLEPIAGVVPFRWLECGSLSRAVVLVVLAPLTILVTGILLSAAVWASSQRRRS